MGRPQRGCGEAAGAGIQAIRGDFASTLKPDRGLRTLLARLGELADYGFFDLAESHESLWESEQPIVIRIHRTQNDNLQKAFASLVFYKPYFHISLFSAIANYLVLRVTEADAKALVRNVASSDQERALIDKIKQMERFKALYFCEAKKKPSPVALLP